jgi:hypothetical protein
MKRNFPMHCSNGARPNESAMFLTVQKGSDQTFAAF